MSIKQISVFVENKPGALSAMTQVLAEQGVDMRALSLAETKDFGIVRIIVDKVYEATTALKDAGYVHSVTPVVGAAIPDAPGGLDQVLRVLSGAGVNVEYMYAFVNPVKQSSACVVLRATDNEKAAGLLKERNIPLISQEELDAI